MASQYYDYSRKPVLTTIVSRRRTMPDDGGKTLFFHAAKGFGKSGMFFDPSEVPDFDGEEAEIEYERIPGRGVRLLRVVNVTKL